MTCWTLRRQSPSSLTYITNKEKKRSRCFLIHGVEENDNEIPCNTAQNVYQKLDFTLSPLLRIFSELDASHQKS